jgi:hypothetical protein
MTKSSKHLDVYLEVGQKRTFAGAIDWPGWCRSGHDESSALQALFEAGPRYAKILSRARLGFKTPSAVSAFVVIERLKGNATTDFGAPDMIPNSDSNPIHDAELRRLQAILKACWRGLDAAVESAQGKTLRKGPRGGGRNIDRIFQHVQDSELSYLSSLGGKVPRTESQQPSLEETRQAILKTLAASAHGEIAEYGPRGGKRWLPRYFVRRTAWHVLDHVWEIEDRII